MLFQVIKKMLKSCHNSNPEVVFGGVTYNQLFAVLRRPCLSLRKEQNRQKMRRFWKTVRKLKGRIKKHKESPEWTPGRPKYYNPERISFLAFCIAGSFFFFVSLILTLLQASARMPCKSSSQMMISAGLPYRSTKWSSTLNITPG